VGEVEGERRERREKGKLKEVERRSKRLE